MKEIQPSNVKKGRIFLGKTIRQADSKSRLDTINQSLQRSPSNESNLSVSALSISQSKMASNLKRRKHEVDKAVIGPDKNILAPQHRLMTMRPSNNLKSSIGNETLN